MITNEGLIIIIFLGINILGGVCISLLESRNYWRRKWEEDEEYILKNTRDKNDK